MALEGGLYTYERGARPYVRLYLCRPSGVAKSYSEPTGVAVWGEGVVRYAVLMAHGGRVGWCSVQTPPPWMLNPLLTWRLYRRDFLPDVDVATDLAWVWMSWVDPLITQSFFPPLHRGILPRHSVNRGEDPMLGRWPRFSP
ncbi:hypothetical protein B296_00051217 [Ensete ventricosum]|uniref:Uncharacterized protein n=1 Tax=Ensete ventricosum TaxID=4639 RepID=A0A426YFP5_ENSVE|nr:hypothetical protein B296_00051217 [Ensete ventricosum]